MKDQEEELAMTDVIDHTETDVRERILVTAANVCFAKSATRKPRSRTSPKRCA